VINNIFCNSTLDNNKPQDESSLHSYVNKVSFVKFFETKVDYSNSNDKNVYKLRNNSIYLLVPGIQKYPSINLEQYKVLCIL
jgi:hypothetical protein